MSIEYYIVLSDKLSCGLAPSGSAIARHSEQLADLSILYGVTPFEEFASGVPVDDGFPIESLQDTSLDDSIPVTPEWHSPADGIRTCQVLIQNIHQLLLIPQDIHDLVTELTLFQQYLHDAAAHGLYWHIAIDL